MKHEIEIPDLPEGWEAVAYRLGDPGEPYYDAITKSICRLILASSVGVLIVRKKQPLRGLHDPLRFAEGLIEQLPDDHEGAINWLMNHGEGDKAGKLRKKYSHPQTRRIVLESTGETRKPKAGEYIQNNGNYCLCRKPDRWGNEHEIWQAVEDNKCAE